MKRTWALALFLGLVFPFSAGADDSLARFEGGIGVVPARVGGVANTVRGTNPGGQPWVIARLVADVKRDGRISVDGRGLLLAGGDNIGTTGGQSVRARLFCGTVAHSSDLVPLESNGDFRIDGVLDPVPDEPCLNPVLLIVGAGGNWFAAGIPRD